MRRSSVDFPEPFAPTRPVRAEWKVALTPSRAMEPFGQMNASEESVIVTVCLSELSGMH